MIVRKQKEDNTGMYANLKGDNESLSDVREQMLPIWDKMSLAQKKNN